MENETGRRKFEKNKVKRVADSVSKYPYTCFFLGAGMAGLSVEITYPTPKILAVVAVDSAFAGIIYLKERRLRKRHPPEKK